MDQKLIDTLTARILERNEEGYVVTQEDLEAEVVVYNQEWFDNSVEIYNNLDLPHITKPELILEDETTESIDLKIVELLQEEARLQEIDDHFAVIAEYETAILIHVEKPVLDYTIMDSHAIHDMLTSLIYEEARIIEQIEIDAITARWNALPDLRACMTKSNVTIANAKAFMHEMITEKNYDVLEALEEKVPLVIADIARNERLKLAKAKRKLIDKGIDILSMAHVVHEEIVVSAETFAQITNSPELALLERYLLNGSLGSAKTLLRNLDITNLPHNEANREELLSLF